MIGDDEVDAVMASRRLALRQFSAIDPQRVSWLWNGRLPRGKIVVLDGDPDVGKSTICVDLAARITTGREMPDDEAAQVPPSPVIVLSGEDGAADTIRPRLDAAGADVSLVHLVEATVVTAEDGAVRVVTPGLPGDLSALEQAINDTGAVLVVVDVLFAFLDGSVKANNGPEVRNAVLTPLKAIAERTDACVVVLRHLRKSGGDRAIYAGGGAIDVTAAARVALVAAYHPDDEGDYAERRRVLAVGKCNLARHAPSLGFRLVGAANEAARVEWLGAVEADADSLTQRGGEPGASDERQSMDETLAELLADGPIPAAEVERLGKVNGWSMRQLRASRKRIGGSTSKSGGNFGGDPGWQWSLTEDAQGALDTQESNLQHLQGNRSPSVPLKMTSNTEGVEDDLSLSLGHLGTFSDGGSPTADEPEADS